MYHIFPVLKSHHLPSVLPYAGQPVPVPPCQQHKQANPGAQIVYPSFLRHNGLRTLHQRQPTLSHYSLGLGSSYAPHAYFDKILTHDVEAQSDAQQNQGKPSLSSEMKEIFRYIKIAFGDDGRRIFLKENLDSLESEVNSLLKLTAEKDLKIEKLEAQVALFKICQAKISQRCFMELWEDGIRQTDPEIYRVYGLPTYPTAANPFPRPTVYNRTFVWHRGMLVMPKLRKMVVTTVTGSQVVNMKDLESISGSIRLCFFWLSSQIHNYLRDYDTPVVFSQHCLTHFALPFMQDFLTGLAGESAVNPEFIG